MEDGTHAHAAAAFFFVKTCREVNEEEKQERLRSEEIAKRIEEEKRMLEMKNGCGCLAIHRKMASNPKLTI